MTEAQVELAKRAVACKGWHWMPGMLALPSEGMISTPVRLTEESDWPHDVGLRLPDLTDPATVGCLLALVREAWGDHATSFANKYEKPTWVWSVYDGRVSSDDYGHEFAKGSTEAEALVAALEAAP
jgi:hypothetical protein